MHNEDRKVAQKNLVFKAQIIKKPNLLFSVHDGYNMSCIVKSELSFLKTHDKIWVVYDHSSIFLI